LKKYLIIASIVLVLGAAAGAVSTYFVMRPRDKIIPATITENPTAKQVQKATAAIKIESQGKVSGEAAITPRSRQDARSKQSAAAVPAQGTDGTTEPRQAVTEPEHPPSALRVDIPVTGEVHARYTDARTGAALGEGTHEIAGTTTVTVGENKIRADTTFDNDFILAVDVPKPDPKCWRVGAMAGIDTHGDFKRVAYGQYDVWQQTWKRISLAVPVRAEWERRDGQDDLRAMVGVEFRF
jgi:hypothetical protein